MGHWRLVVALVLVGSMTIAGGVQATTAAGAEPFDFERDFGKDGSSSSSFSKAGSVAVDQADDVVYVLDREANSLFKFDLHGNPVPFGGSSPNISGNELSGIPIGGGSGERQVAVDSSSHVVYLTGEPSPAGFATAVLAFEADGEPHVFSAGPASGTNKLTGFEKLQGVAVDSTGAIYAADLFDSNIKVFRATGAPVVEVDPEGFISLTNIAVDSEGVVYATLKAEAVRRLQPSEYPVTSETNYAVGSEGLDTGSPYSVAVDPATNDVYVVDQGASEQVSVFDEEGNLITAFGGPGDAGELSSPEGVAIDSDEERAFVAQSPEGDSSTVAIFQREICICPPAIESTRASNVTADSAHLYASISPQNLETTVWFEFGLSECDGVNPCAKVPSEGEPIGNGRRPVSVTEVISGLKPHTTYHYRAVAENDEDLIKGPDNTFTTQGSGLGFMLGDSRVWEMVSPSDKHGGVLMNRPGGIIQAAENGNGFAYVTLGSIEAEPEGNRAVEQSSVLARRGGDGWRSKDITPPHVKAGNAKPAEYRVMTPDLSKALMEGRDNAPLSPLTTERTPYLRENTEPPVYTPLLTTKEGFENVPPGTVFDPAVGSGSELAAIGANRMLTHVVFKSPAALVAGADFSARYLWSGGEIQPVTQLPLDEGGGVVRGVLGSGAGSSRRAISDDGTRVFWSSGEYLVGNFLTGLYMRDTVAEESVRLDLVQSGGGGGTTLPSFQAASADGSVVFFTDSHQLTENASPEGRDLYRCEIPDGASLDGCAILTDISVPLAGSGEIADVQDQALAVSEDGMKIYFIATGVLADTPNDEGDVALAGAPNLYLWAAGDGISFVATLSKSDAIDWGGQSGNGYAAHVVANASPDGRYLAFVSDRSLTGYDNIEAKSGKSAREVFRYDAETEELACISCNPTGASPRAQVMSGDQIVDPPAYFSGGRAAAILPQARTLEAGGVGDRESFYRPRVVLEDGRVFFNAFDSLVPADSNGDWDVYQYQPTGVGSCTDSSESAAVAPSGNGCVGLISSGGGEEEAAFLDATPSGNDVFILSSARLSAIDEDDVYDVYDARVNGRVEEPDVPSECLGEACQPAAVVPQDPTPGSAAYQGAGNVKTDKRCPKGKRKVRRNGKVKCIPKRKGHQREAHSKRRAGR